MSLAILFHFLCAQHVSGINPFMPNDSSRGRNAPLTSKCCILYIYSTNIGTEYFKHGLYSPSFSLQNAVCFIILKNLVPVLFTFYIQSVLKLKKNNSGAKSLIYPSSGAWDYSVELPHWSYCSWFDVCWSFGVVGLEWYPCCRLQPSAFNYQNDARSNKHKIHTE